MYLPGTVLTLKALHTGGLVISEIVNSDVLVFDISSLHSGLYIVVLSKGKNLRMAKVIKP